MISFIVIGLNEAKTLAKCFESIEKAALYLHLNKFEMIYVDSASTDNSIEIVSKFQKVGILKITGKCNAPIARNIGFKESQGDILFFIDADMEILPEFLQSVLEQDGNLKYDAVTGQLINYFYNQQSDTIEEVKEIVDGKDRETFIGRGMFLIKRNIFHDCNGFNTKYKAWEDYDLVLKLDSLGYKFVLKSEHIACHHTISRKSRTKIWNSIFTGKECLRGVLYRNHIFNLHVLKLILRNEYSGGILFISVFLSIITGIYFFLLLYLLINFTRILIWKPDNVLDWLNKSLALFVRELSTVIGFLFYYPKRKELKYQTIRSINLQ